MRIGLVLDGGGGKGSYQLGAWQAFEEYGIKFDVISGTSIGAINGALMTITDLATAEQFWLGSESKATELMHGGGTWIQPEDVDKMNHCFADHFVLKEANHQNGRISNEPMFAALNQLLNEESLANLKNDLYVCSASGEETPQVKYFNVNKMNLEDAKKAIISSTALPYIFDGVEIQGIKYYDGGILDGVPIKPVYESNCDLIFVVYLHDNIRLDYRPIAGCPIVPIIPSVDLGDFETGCMDVSQEGVKWRKQKGYEDTKKLLKGLDSIFIK